MDDEERIDIEALKALGPPPGISIDIRNSKSLPTCKGGFFPWPQIAADEVNVGELVAEAMMVFLVFRRERQVEALESLIIEAAKGSADQDDQSGSRLGAPWLAACVESIRPDGHLPDMQLSPSAPSDPFPFLKTGRYHSLTGNPYQGLHEMSNETHVSIEIRTRWGAHHNSTFEGTAAAFTTKPHRLVGIAAARAIFAFFKGRQIEQIRGIEDLLLGTVCITGFPEKLKYAEWAPAWLLTAVSAIRQGRSPPPSG